MALGTVIPNSFLHLYYQGYPHACPLKKPYQTAVCWSWKTIFSSWGSAGDSGFAVRPQDRQASRFAGAREREGGLQVTSSPLASLCPQDKAEQESQPKAPAARSQSQDLCTRRWRSGFCTIASWLCLHLRLSRTLLLLHIFFHSCLTDILLFSSLLGRLSL